MILNEEGKKEFLTSDFHTYIDIELSCDIKTNNITQFSNFVLPIQKLYEYIDEQYLKSLFNKEYNNVFFTTQDNNVIHRYEYYQKVFFIRMTPFGSLRMHFVPKKYDASDSKTDKAILIFKDNKQNINKNNFSCTEEYQRDNEKNTINLYYQLTEQKPSNGLYLFNIKNQTKNLNKLQINMGYSYNDTNPTDKLKHYTGVLDMSNQNGDLITDNNYTEYNKTLVDANYDNVSDYTNVSKMITIENSPQWPSDTTPYNDNVHDVGFNNEHTINQIYHKTIKYINDDIYIEENNESIIQMWNER